ncbi:uncharacterized protein JCM6883_004072 [Sporobolomyces salmoneus]|uniref:uncharacterized protein n=1 Tax=Sporobolomyces salmoneus TaxID=183962 RepID=UPI0031798A8D
MATSTHPSSNKSSSPSTENAPNDTSNDANKDLSEAEQKRRHRADKKAEQLRRKEERKRIALETGVDPALLPEAIGSEVLSNGKIQPKGFRAREWAQVPTKDGENKQDGSKKVSIMSWNMLAQALVRRELFPGSDCLKGKDRIPPLMAEVLYYAPDVACLQECDRLSDHLPHLTLTHSYTSFIGYRNKPHGLLIAHKNTVFDKVGERGLRLDEQPIEDDLEPLPAMTSESASSRAEDEHVDQAKDAKPPASESTEEERPPDAATPSSRASRRAAGLSRTTRNVALFVALAFKDRPNSGIIVGTTHLFWHPKHVYERVRQTGILLREANKFREESPNGAWKDWPVFLAGDFNTQPCELTYRLLLGSRIDKQQVDEFNHSACVHYSVDKFYDPSFEPPTPDEPEAKEGEEAVNQAEEDPDKVIKNARPARPEDGLADIDKIKKLYGYKEGGSGIRSAYGENYGLVKGQEENWYCARRPEVQNGNDPKPKLTEEEVKERVGSVTWEERVARGDFEPIYTNFTPLWRCTLDFIFLLPALPSTSHPSIRFTSLLKMHDESAMGAGLPRKGIEPSDHVAIATEVELSQ